MSGLNDSNSFNRLIATEFGSRQEKHIKDTGNKRGRSRLGMELCGYVICACRSLSVCLSKEE